MNSKILTLAGAVILIIGLFLPAVTVMGMQMNVLLPAGELNKPALILVGCAVLAAILALAGQGKWAVIPGLGAAGYLVWSFLDAQKSFSGGADLTPEAADALSAMAPSLNYLGWGVMGLGAVLILIGGAMGFKSSPPPAA